MYMRDSSLVATASVPIEHGESSSKVIFTLRYFHFQRLQLFTPHCYHLCWRFGRGWGKTTSTPSSLFRRNPQRAIFLKQYFITPWDWRLNWGIIQRQIPESLRENADTLAVWTKAQRFSKLKFKTIEETEEVLALNGNDLARLEEWLYDQYPEIGVNLRRMPHKLGYSYFISGLFLLVVITALLGLLTRFHLGEVGQACWFLVWIYGGPLLRWKWFNDQAIQKKPCLSASKWLLFGIWGILTMALMVAVCGGIATISVNLLAAICNTTLEPTVAIWTLIGVSIAVLFAAIVVGVCYFSPFAR
jgi:hypothetical protein